MTQQRTNADRRSVRLPKWASVVAAAALALLGSFAGPMAFAQPQGTPPPAAAPATAPVETKWALSPTGTNPNEPGSRPNLSYDLTPGGSVDDSVTVWNDSDRPASFKVYATDAFSTPTGGFDLLRADQRPAGLGSWITVDAPIANMNPHSKADIAIHLRVPADATPGDHAAGIVASAQSVGADDKGNQVTIDKRVGSRVYLRVAGPVTPLLTVETISATYRATANPFGSGEVDVSYTVRNAGNVRLSAHTAMQVSGFLGLSTQRRDLPDVPELLPGAAVTRSDHFQGVFPAVRTSADVSLTAFSTSTRLDPEPERVDRSTSIWTMPWTLLALLLVVAGCARVGLRARHRRRRGRAAGSPMDPTDVDANAHANENVDVDG